MSGKIWLICEDEEDADVIQRLLDAKKISVKVKLLKPNRKPGSISRLPDQLHDLIRQAKVSKSSDDCIAVLHDADELTQPIRTIYKRIEQICKSENVALVIARDELESWLLADGGLCQWLKEKQRNWDEQPRPSDTLRSWLQSKVKLKYQGADRAKVLSHLDGTGDNFSPSMKKALEHLEDAPCIRD